jgi:hypothetical protein
MTDREIKQKSLFGGRDHVLGVKEKPAKAPAQPRSFPQLHMAFALDKTQATADGVFWLRILQGYYNRSLTPANAHDYINTVKDEIAIKTGELPTDLAIKNALLRRFGT